MRLGAHLDAVCAVGNAGGRHVRAAPAAGWFMCPTWLAGDGMATHPNYLLHKAALPLQFKPQAQGRKKLQISGHNHIGHLKKLLSYLPGS